jgi:pimeloyl-ACP methyl ester carboxylesterase
VTPSIVRYVEAADGTRIAWHTHTRERDDAGPLRARVPVVLTNGLSTTPNFWDPLVTELAPDHRVVHWSYRGHFDSESARTHDYSIATHADDLARVTSAVRSQGTFARPPVHVAFSMGVTVALEMVRRRPDLASALILVAGGADAPHAGSAFMRAPGAARAVRAALGAVAPVVPRLSPIASRVARSPAIYTLARATGAIGAAAPRAEVETFFRAVGSMDLEAYWESMRSLMDAHASDVLGRVRVPTLVISPERDLLASVRDLEAMRTAIPGAEWMYLPHTSHALLLEAGTEVARRIRDFIADHADRIGAPAAI